MRLIPVERSWFPSCKQPAEMRTLTDCRAKNSGRSRANNGRTEEAHQTKAWRTRSSASSLIVRLERGLQIASRPEEATKVSRLSDSVHSRGHGEQGEGVSP